MELVAGGIHPSSLGVTALTDVAHLAALPADSTAEIFTMAGGAIGGYAVAGCKTVEILVCGVQPACGRVSACTVVAGKATHVGVTAGKIRAVAACAIFHTCGGHAVTMKTGAGIVQPASRGVSALTRVALCAALSA